MASVGATLLRAALGARALRVAGVAAGIAGDGAQALGLRRTSRTSLTSVQARFSAAGPR